MGLSRAEHAEGTLRRPRVDPARGTLIGSRCDVCGAQSWPGRAVCARCGSDQVELVGLPATGALLSFTTVWVPRPNLPAPYVLGQVDFGRGASIFGHVRGLPDDAVVPLDVRVVIPDENGDGLLSFWFEPLAPTEDTGPHLLAG